MLLVKNNLGKAIILIGSSASWLERHAANELKRYINTISGAELSIIQHAPKSGAVVAIGRTETNPLIADAHCRGQIRLSSCYPGGDGFIIQTVQLDKRDILILGGSSDRGSLYAVYAFLEDTLGVGFFRDGEQIPRRPGIELQDIHIVEKPCFNDRQEGNGCIYAYSTPYWTWEDWKSELDWKAKRRVNIIWPFNVGGNIIQTIMAEWGVFPESKPPSEKKSTHEKAFEYAHQLGMRIPCILPNGCLPGAFFEKYPNCRKLVTQWSELAPTTQLHPADPLFRHLIVDYIRHYTRSYGTDHLYIAEFTSESEILSGAGDPQEARLDFARAMSEAIREADPEGVWIPSSWSFDFHSEPPKGWTVSDVHEYLEAITVPFVVWDLWSEEEAKYEVTDYFFGQPWGFGVLHSFGGNSYLHGDVVDLIGRVQVLVKDPKADRCDLFLSMPEIIDFNGFYLELCAQLSWNPSDLDIESYVVKYCTRRYGEKLGRALVPVWKDLIDTVYGRYSGSVIILMDPLYWLRPNLSLVHGSPKLAEKIGSLWPRRAAYIPKLRHAIEVFLSQKKMIGESPMATRDLVDIARQWIAERFNQEIRRARDAFIEARAADFEDAAESCLKLLDQQVRLLSSWPPYRLDLKIKRAKLKFGGDASRSVKHIHLWVLPQEGQESKPLLDYYRMDLDGLVADYYRPRVAAYLNVLRSKMAAGEMSLSDEELDPIYSRIERDFIAMSVRSLSKGEAAVAVIRELLDADVKQE